MATYEPLTPEQKALRDGYLERFPNVIAMVIKLLPQAVRAMRHQQIETEEIESLAWTAVMKAARRYRTPSNATFDTYANAAIRSEIIARHYTAKAKCRNPENGAIVNIDGARKRGRAGKPVITWDMQPDRTGSDVDANEEAEHLGVIRLRVRFAIDELKGREKEIVKMRFGVDGKEPMTLLEVSKEYGVSRERIRQIEAKALEKLKPKLKSIWDAI